MQRNPSTADYQYLTSVGRDPKVRPQGANLPGDTSCQGLPYRPIRAAPDRETDRQRNARPKPRTTKVVVWRTDTHLPVSKRRPHTHPSRRKPMPQTNPHTTGATTCQPHAPRIQLQRVCAFHIHVRSPDARTDG